MQQQRVRLLFSIVFLIAIFFPFQIFADGSYPVFYCQVDYKYDSGKGMCVKDGATAPAEKRTLQYEGLVPCGKCLKIQEPAAGIPLADYNSALALTTKERCNEAGPAFKQVYLNCQLCHSFVMLNDIIGFFLTKIIPPVAGLMLVIGGVMFYFGGARPDLLSRGKKLLVGVMVGLFLIYGAYMLVGLFLKILGATNFNPVNQVFKHGVFSIDCPIEIPKP